jgi:hypothetical protein
MLKTYRNEAIIALYFVLLCGHFVLHHYRKIFPSFVFPAFSSAPVIKDHVDYKTTHLYAIKSSGQAVEIDPKEFFVPGYAPFVNYQLKTIMVNEKKYATNKYLRAKRAEFVSYAKKQLTRLHPNDQYQGIIIESRSNAYLLKGETIQKDTAEPVSTIINF